MVEKKIWGEIEETVNCILKKNAANCSNRNIKYESDSGSQRIEQETWFGHNADKATGMPEKSVCWTEYEVFVN